MLSAPAAIAATRVIAFAAGFAPPLLSAPLIPSLSLTSSGKRARSARPSTGSSPASATKFGSSNTASTRAALWVDRTYEMPFQAELIDP
jgi:hypothetical protein